MSVERHAELYEKQGSQVYIFKDILWKEYQRMVIPVGPAKLNFLHNIKKFEEMKILLQKFPKALMVRTTDGFNNKNPCKEWFAVVNSKFIDLEDLSINTRSKVRRGLKNCNVEMVDAKFIAEHGYKVYISALKNYKGVILSANITEEQYKRNITLTKDFDDIVHYWGVFRSNKLIAYSLNYIYDNIEANYSTIKFHPDFLKLYPSYALIYIMNKFYLKDRLFEYVNDGFRNILHQTNIQEFLIEKFGFKQAFTKLEIFYRSPIFYYLSVTFPLRKIFSKTSPKLSALYKLEEIRRKSKNFEKINSNL